MSKLEKLKEKARSLEAKDPKGAIEAWQQVLKGQEEDGDPNPDLAIFNRIGDLYLKVRDPAQAADFYDQAVDKYAELGFHNNAIAMCNKVLRNAPGRQNTYLKLAKLYASKGFMAEAKQNFVDYAERMHKIGKIQQAFAALKELADISPEGAHLRETLEEHLRMYGDPERRPAGTAAPPKAPPADDPSKSGKRKTSSLVFLDVDAPPIGKGPGPVKGRVPLPPKPAPAPPPKPEPEPEPALEPEAVGDSLLETVTAEPDTSLEIETRVAKAAPPAAPVAPKRPAVGAPPRFGGGAAPKAPEPPKVKPVVPKRPGPPPRKSLVEVPPLELEPDFDTGATDQGHEVDDQPLVIDDAHERVRGSAGGGRRSGAIDLNLDGVVNQGDERGSLVFTDMDMTPAKPTIEELEARVADDPDDPEAHQALGEALIETGERARGIEELDLATTGFETRGNLARAQDLVGEILRLDPNSVRHRQKQVEFAFKSGDKAKLIDAYLELADTLLRSDLPDKARAVYKRVAEHDPANERAKAALAMLAPVATPPPESPAKPKAKVRDTEGKTAARDAKMKVADEEPTGDEEQDFQEMLARFKQGIDENIDEGDFQSHYDLGVAFKEMGLLDEAIAELQKALRAPDGKLRSSEALGVCFLDKGAYVVAESILRRALDLPASGDQERLGVLYWLGRALAEPGGGRHGSAGGDARRGRRVDSPRHPGARRLGRPFGAAAGDADAQCAVLAPGRRDHGRLPVLAGDHRAGPPGRSRAVAGVRPGDERDDDR